MELTQRMECTQGFTGAQPATQVGFLGILGQIYAVNKGPNKIGRDACTCDIALDNVTLSRHHAVINVLSNQVVMLMDLGSANKTKLKGKNLPPYIPHPLSNGDTVQFGDALGIFRMLHDDTDLPMTQVIASPQATAAPRHAPNVLVPQSPEPSDEEDFLPASQSPFLRDTNREIAPTSSLYTNLQRNTTPVQVNKDNDDSFLNEFDDVQKMNNELNTAETQLPAESNIFNRNPQIPDIIQFDDHNFQKPSPKISTPRTYSRQNIHEINTQLHTFKKPSVYEAQTQIADLSDQEIHMSIIEAQTQIEQYNTRGTGLGNINEAQTQIGNINETQIENINELINELDSHLTSANECFDKNSDETCVSANVSSSGRNSDNEVILFSDVDASDSFIESQPIIPTDSGCEVTTPVKKCVMDSDLEISFEDMATQVIFNEEVNFNPQQEAMATDVCDDTEQATQIIPTTDIDFEDLATQVICNESIPETSATMSVKCESPFKIPFIVPPKSDRKESIKSEIDDRYYSCTQDILGDLCTQKDYADDMKNTGTTIAPPKDISKKSCDSEMTNVTDSHFLEEEDSQTVFVAKLSKKGHEGDVTPLKTNILELSVSDLPSSQEITKTLERSSSKTVPDEDTMEEDEQKLDALSSIQPRVITRVRRPPARYDVTKNLFKAEIQPLVDADIMEENAKRLKKCQSENDNDVQPPKKTKKHQRRSISLAHLQVQDDDDDMPIKNPSNRDKIKKSERKGSSNTEIKTNSSPESKTSARTETKTTTRTETKTNARTEIKTNARTETKTNARTETKSTASSDAPATTYEAKKTTTSEPKATTSNEAKATTSTEPKATTSNEAKATTSTEPKATTSTEAKATKSTEAKATTSNEAKATTSTEPKATTSTETKATTSSETKGTSETLRKSSRSRQKRTDAKPTAEHEKKHVDRDEIPKGRHRTEKKEPKKYAVKDQDQPSEKNTEGQEDKPVTGMSTRAVSAKRQSEDIPSTSSSNVTIPTDTDKNESVRTTRNKVKSEEQDKTDRRSRSKTTTEEKSQETPESSNPSLVDDAPGPSKRKASEPSCSSSAKRTRRGASSHSSTSLKGKATTPAPRVLFTAVPDEKIKNQLAQLGAILVQEVQSCTVIVTLQIKRTFKFLCGIGLGKPIVGLKWVQACIDTNSFVDPWRYLLKDPAAETRFKFSLRRTLLGKRDFLRGYNITSTPNVVLPPPEFKMIVECSGGAWQEGGSRWLAVSTPADRAMWPILAERGATVVSPELVLAGVLRQRLQIPQNIIYPKRASDKNRTSTTRN